MSKKHFVALAAELKYRKPCPIARPKGYAERFAVWQSVVEGVADVCSRFNPNFDRSRFIKACES